MTTVAPQPTGVMAELSERGDTRITWNKYKSDEVDAAREHFDTLQERGFAAFAVKKTGGKGERVYKFDPDAEKIILVPQIVGG